MQVLNEFANVLRKKQQQPWSRIEAALAVVRAGLDEIHPLDLETHGSAVAIARDHQVGLYDALIVASALGAGCRELASEDFQHGRSFGSLSVRNPFL